MGDRSGYARKSFNVTGCIKLLCSSAQHNATKHCENLVSFSKKCRRFDDELTIMHLWHSLNLNCSQSIRIQCALRCPTLQVRIEEESMVQLLDGTTADIVDNNARDCLIVVE